MAGNFENGGIAFGVDVSVVGYGGVSGVRPKKCVVDLEKAELSVLQVSKKSMDTILYTVLQEEHGHHSLLSPFLHSPWIHEFTNIC